MICHLAILSDLCRAFCCLATNPHKFYHLPIYMFHDLKSCYSPMNHYKHFRQTTRIRLLHVFNLVYIILHKSKSLAKFLDLCRLKGRQPTYLHICYHSHCSKFQNRLLCQMPSLRQIYLRPHDRILLYHALGYQAIDLRIWLHLAKFELHIHVFIFF